MKLRPKKHRSVPIKLDTTTTTTHIPTSSQKQKPNSKLYKPKTSNSQGLETKINIEKIAYPIQESASSLES